THPSRTHYYTLSLHDALPILSRRKSPRRAKGSSSTIRARIFMRLLPSLARSVPMGFGALELKSVHRRLLAPDCTNAVLAPFRTAAQDARAYSRGRRPAKRAVQACLPVSWLNWRLPAKAGLAAERHER